MKKIIIISTLFLALLALIVVKRMTKRKPTAVYTIGILQTASHPALDAARDGFIEELKRLMGDKIDFVINNAQGSIAHVHSIAQQFHANKQMSGFFAIATPAAQALSSVEKEKPIMIAAVTDPQALGLLHPKTNICGTQDLIDVKAEIDMLVHLVPHAKVVGLLYTSGEVNSLALVKMMRAELEARGLSPIDFAANGESDMPVVVQLACRKSDVILAPTDNTVASSISLIASIAHKAKKPLIVSDNMLVASGALAARGVDYKTSGKEAAHSAYATLVEGKKPYELPIIQPKSNTIWINRQTLHALGLTVPQALKDHVVEVS
jgi:putative tryptophan/tyrosine transport system substrate-binding protein